MNEATLIGNLGNDPEIRTTNNGSRVCNFSLATTEKWKDKQSGEKRERTEWHRVVVFQDGLVGVLEKYVKKGDKLMVRGSIQTRKWQDKAGVDKYTTEIVVQGFGGQIELLGGSGGGGNKSSGGYGDYQRDSGGYSSQSSSGSTSGQSNPPDLDDDIPF